MKKHATFGSRATLLLLLLAASGSSACSPSVPANPTWADDIHPLLKARCVRCHNDPGAGDPEVPKGSVATGGIPASQSFDYANLADVPMPTLGILLQAGDAITKGSALAKVGFMPPLPAEPLADWEIQLIKNWLKENPKL